ncbi:hypothetical protein Zmor_012354 [Zophobas morio]|uniref:EF-hand domain-containing protein n=1 Tax=Zophobas morio TaxID=2755281 RepID=A0AA38HJC5_9CUCU|nr:hypothetical protein Zmor_012354 [Zophobas morio]
MNFSEEQIVEIQEAFSIFDTESIGEIKCKDLEVAVGLLGLNFQNDEFQKDLQKSGLKDAEKINFEDFLKFLSTSQKERNFKKEATKVFKLFDYDEKGYISIENLRKIASELGESITEQELKEMIEEGDRDGDGFVGKEDFIQLLEQSKLLL